MKVTLSIELCIDDGCETVKVFENLKVPIPLCSTNFTSLLLPGNGTIQGFAAVLANNVGEAAVDVVVEKLGLTVSVIDY